MGRAREKNIGWRIDYFVTSKNLLKDINRKVEEIIKKYEFRAKQSTPFLTMINYCVFNSYICNSDAPSA